MRGKLERPSPREDAQIARAIAADPDAAPDLSRPVSGIARRIGRPVKADPKVSVTLRLDRDVIERFRSKGPGWQTRINAALKKSPCDERAAYREPDSDFPPRKRDRLRPSPKRILHPQPGPDPHPVLHVLRPQPFAAVQRRRRRDHRIV